MKVDDKTLAILTELGKKLGVTAEHMWSVLVRQARVEMVLSAWWGFLSLIGLSICVYTARGVYKTGNPNDDAGLFIFSIVGAIIFFLALVIALQSFVEATLNPEYIALVKLRQLVK